MRSRYELAGTEERVLEPLSSAVYLKALGKVHRKMVLYTWDCPNKNLAQPQQSSLEGGVTDPLIVYSSVTCRARVSQSDVRVATCEKTVTSKESIRSSAREFFF